MTNGRLFSDVDYGDILRVTPLADETTKRYIFPGGYSLMGLVNITRIVDLKLSAVAYRLALIIVTRSAVATNLIHCSNEQYAKDLGVNKTWISRTVAKLRKHGLVDRMGARTLMVNPYWAFKGTPAQHEVAIAEWNRLHPIGLVKSGKKVA